MRFKVGDIVLVSSPAGKAIPDVHVKLLKRIVVKPARGNRMDWPGYSGWEATLVFLEEIEYLKKEWSIPYTAPGKDVVFVYDCSIIKKPRTPKPNPVIIKKLKIKNQKKIKTSKSGVKVIRRNKRKNESRTKSSVRVNSKTAKK